MQRSVNATAPHVNAAVRASAGTGKTWLLISRLVRLLLTGVSPQAILAVTFTRKAAAEMHNRLLARLFDLAACPDERLDGLLDAMGLPADDGARRRARDLYEELLTGAAQVNITTFHAFCQSILRRFPLEADVPPGFDVVEDTGLIEEAAWDALFEESTRDPGGPLGRALEALFVQCGGLHGARSVLDEFLQRRNDWLAYTQGAANDGIEYATGLLSRRLAVDPDTRPAHCFFTQETHARLAEFHQWLLKHPTDTNRRHAALLDLALDASHTDERRLDWTWRAFFTQKAEPLARKGSDTLRKRMGDAGQARFLELHQLICDDLRRIRALQYRLDTFNLSRAWYEAGTRLLAHYQNIKNEQRLLDFADLEWKAYTLLNQADHMQWVQYKLDQSIEHILIDEFQDTNPTQWHLIEPLMRELTGEHADSPRSVFLVGDDKQSIYRFRRAEPRLFDIAIQWLNDRPNGVTYDLAVSYRSAPAIADFVNRVFGGGALREQMNTFVSHRSHHQRLWGRVELLPLAASPPAQADDAPAGMRNPLERPRPQTRINRHYIEGQCLARRIKALLQEQVLLGEAHDARPLRPSDIIILVRDRTHAAEYELALRDAGIPYLGISRGSLLSSLEVTDMMALLNTLVAPHDNLALAVILRSPLFAGSDEDLMTLAAYRAGDGPAAAGTWFERLTRMAPGLPPGSPLSRACRWLCAWRALADRVPVHDLLDRIYSEGNVIARYEAAFPDHLQGRVRANLTRFIELALEVDSGRYPSLTHFLSVLRNLQERDREGPDEGPPASLNAVRLMTIHAAKGLESPVVIVADTARVKQRSQAYHAMVEWPAEAERPRNFFLTGKPSQMDELSRRLHDADGQAARREEVNLLYVALTRARQVLIISGCRSDRDHDPSWYDLMAQRVAPEGVNDTPWVHEQGRRPQRPAAPPAAGPVTLAAGTDRLARPLTLPGAGVAEDVTPSRAAGHGPPDDRALDREGARVRGIAIHRMLELLSNGGAALAPAPPRGVANELGLDGTDPEYLAWWREACHVYQSPRLARLFDPRCYTAAYNEVPLHYVEGQRGVHGVIDRLVLYEEEAVVLDYKTHAGATAGNLAALAAGYTDPLGLYRQGVRRLFPDKRIRTQLLFTACAELYEVDDDP